jgi:DNA-directed RNA polymerase specialized sigma24 family protein
MNWQRIEPWDYVVVAVASEYHRKYTMVELEDIKQSLYEWFIEHPNKLDEWEAIGKRDAKNLIYRSLRNQALDYCQRWKAKSVGYEVSDLFYYAPEVVEAMLPAVLRHDLTITPQLNLGGSSTPTAPSEGGNLMAMMIEIDWGYWKLSKDDRRIIFLRHAESMDYKEISNALSLGSEDAARMRTKRALNRLINKIGGHKPYRDEDSTPAGKEVEPAEAESLEEGYEHNNTDE